MFLPLKSAAVVAVIGIAAPPASAAIVDIFVTGSVTSASSLTDTPIDWVPPANALHQFADADKGDSLSVHWVMDTDAGFEETTEDGYTINSFGYYDFLESDITFNNASYDFENSEGGTVGYSDQPNNFALSYNTFDYSPSWGDEYVDWAGHEFDLNERPKEYASSLGLLNEFSLSGDNVGDGRLYLETRYNPETGEPDIFSVNYQATSVTATLRDTSIAPAPLPAGILLIATGLFGFGLLRHRKS